MDDTQRFKELKERVTDLSNKKIRLEERYNNGRTRLEKLLTEITEKGYDPKKLSEIRQQKEEVLKKLLEDLEKETNEIQEKLNLIEA